MRCKLTIWALCLPLATMAQSHNQNYVAETVFLDSVGTGITTVGYFDGLGNRVETVTTGSGTDENVCSYITYDSMGREETAWCPTPVDGGLEFRPLSDIIAASNTFYNDGGAYTRRRYSRAGRTVTEWMAGERWHSTGSVTVVDHDTNTATDKVLVYNGTRPQGLSFRHSFQPRVIHGNRPAAVQVQREGA